MVTKLVVVKVVVSPLYVRREGRKATPQATFSEALKVMKYKGVWKLLGLRKKLSPIHKCYYVLHSRLPFQFWSNKNSSKHNNGFALFGEKNYEKHFSAYLISEILHSEMKNETFWINFNTACGMQLKKCNWNRISMQNVHSFFLFFFPRLPTFLCMHRLCCRFSIPTILRNSCTL